MSLPWSWTFSQQDTFTTCAFKYYRTKVLRDIVEPPTEHTIWGEKVHTAFENRVLHGTQLPEGMAHWTPLIEKIMALPGEKYPEIKLAVNDAFQPAEWGSSWCRGIADLLIIDGKNAAVFDWKTGRKKPSDQLSLYAAKVFSHYPEVEVCDTRFVWLKEKKMTPERFTREDIPVIWNKFLPTIRRMEIANETGNWKKNPSGLCRGWCPVKDCSFYKAK